jgi:hypothetical protein
MRSFRILNKRAGLVAAVSALLLGFVVAPFAAAATVSERSIALSTANSDASGVAYQINFTPVSNAGAFVVDFCTNTPLLGEACTAPSGFTVAGATSATSGFTDVGEPTVTTDHNTLRVTGTMTAATPVSVDVAGVHNPTAAGTFYARIVTYVDATAADAYVPATPGTHIDDGGVALSIKDKISVSAAVLENMTFCISGETLTANCVGNGAAAPALTAPTLKLGEGTGDVLALSSAAISTGNIYTQLSTNAAGGAIISLKSGVACGGMKRVGASVCDIPATLTTNLAAGTPGFGLKTNTPAGVGTNSGTLRPMGAYNTSTYALNYLANNTTGVTSAYGDPVIDSNAAPVSNMNLALTFGATISNQTPAGLYSADLSLIATGKF